MCRSCCSWHFSLLWPRTELTGGRANVGQAGRREESRRPRVGGVQMTPEDHNSDAARAGQLEGCGRRLGAAAGDPRVVYNKDVAAGNRIADAHPAWVNAPCVDLFWGYGQPHRGEGNTRTGPCRQRMPVPGRPCPLRTTATAVGPAFMSASRHSAPPLSRRKAASDSRSRAAASGASAARSDLYRRKSSASGPPRTAYPIGATASARTGPASLTASSHS